MRDYAKPLRVPKNIVGAKYGDLTVVSMLGSYNKRVFWLVFLLCTL